MMPTTAHRYLCSEIEALKNRRTDLQDEVLRASRALGTANKALDELDELIDELERLAHEVKDR